MRPSIFTTWSLVILWQNNAITIDLTGFEYHRKHTSWFVHEGVYRKVYLRMELYHPEPGQHHLVNCKVAWASTCTSLCFCTEEVVWRAHHLTLVEPSLICWTAFSNLESKRILPFLSCFGQVFFFFHSKKTVVTTVHYIKSSKQNISTCYFTIKYTMLYYIFNG